MIKFILYLYISIYTNAVDRIAEVVIDRSKPFPIYMNPGRTTTIDLPCSASYALAGTYNDLKAEIGPDKDSSIVLWLTSHASTSTNLVVRCDDRVIVFDVIPSRINHQDYLKVLKISSGSRNAKLIATSSEKAFESNRKKILIKKSEGR